MQHASHSATEPPILTVTHVKRQMSGRGKCPNTLSSRHVSRSSSDVGLAAMHLSGYSDHGLIVSVAFAGGVVFTAVFFCLWTRLFATNRKRDNKNIKTNKQPNDHTPTHGQSALYPCSVYLLPSLPPLLCAYLPGCLSQDNSGNCQ